MASIIQQFHFELFLIYFYESIYTLGFSFHFICYILHLIYCYTFNNGIFYDKNLPVLISFLQAFQLSIEYIYTLINNFKTCAWRKIISKHSKQIFQRKANKPIYIKHLPLNEIAKTNFEIFACMISLKYKTFWRKENQNFLGGYVNACFENFNYFPGVNTWLNISLQSWSIFSPRIPWRSATAELWYLYCKCS